MSRGRMAEQKMDASLQTETPRLAPRRWMLFVALALIFGLGLAVRLYDLGDAPLDFHPTRQLHSMLMARGMAYQALPDVPDWQREMSFQQWKKEGLIEPPVMEWLTAQAYLAAGQVDLRLPRLFSIFFWMLGGAGIFLLAKTLSGPDGGLVGAAYFLVLPYAVLASRAFQPDPLLTAAIIWALWAALRWQMRPSWGRAALAGVLCGLAIFIKSTAVFFVGGGLVGLVLAGWGLRRALRDGQVWLAAVLTVLPYALFHIYGVYISGELQSQFSLRFFPQMWVDPVFYLRWNGQIASTVGFEWFLLALLGTFTIKDSRARAMLLGAWVGYFVYGMTLPHHISTHDYYQLPLIPLAALAAAAGAAALFRALRGPRALVSLAVVGVLLYGLTIKAWDARVSLKRQDYRQEAVFWEKLGERLGRDRAVVGLTQDYGFRLSYWGWVDTTNWMTSGDFSYRELAGQEFDMRALFDEVTAGEDLFVVTLLGELDHQPELKKILDENYRLIESSSDVLIYDLRQAP